MSAAHGNDQLFMPGAPGFLALLVAIGEQPGIVPADLHVELERQFGRAVTPASIRRALHRLARMGFLAEGGATTGLELLNFKELADTVPGDVGGDSRLHPDDLGPASS